jgi:hypothetical protein
LVASQLSARSRIRLTRKYSPTARLDAASYLVPVVPPAWNFIGLT